MVNKVALLAVVLVSGVALFLAGCGNKDGVRGKLVGPDAPVPPTEATPIKVIGKISPTVQATTRFEVLMRDGRKFNATNFCMVLVESAKKVRFVQYSPFACPDLNQLPEPQFIFATQPSKLKLPIPVDKTSAQDYEILKGDQVVGHIRELNTLAVNPISKKVELKDLKITLESLCPEIEKATTCTPVFDETGTLIWLN